VKSLYIEEKTAAINANSEHKHKYVKYDANFKVCFLIERGISANMETGLFSGITARSIHLLLIFKGNV